MNTNDYVYFVLERNSNASYSFTGYTDKETGEVKFIYQGRKDKKHGHDLPHRFMFDRAHRTIRVLKNAKDIKGNSIVEHLRNFPHCKDSKNGQYRDGVQTGYMFREVKETADAENAIQAKMKKTEAESLALNLKGVDLEDMALLYGIAYKGGEEAIAKHRLIDQAGADPEKFIELLESPARKAKALLKKAQLAGDIKIDGTIYIWKTKTIGVTEELAIAEIIQNKDLAKAIETNLKKTGNG